MAGQRKYALAEHLGIHAAEVSMIDDETYSADGGEYRVLTDDEADKACEDYINESLWAFNAEFIAQHTRTTLSQKQISAIQKMQSELCEDANEIVRALIYDFDKFVQDAVSADGRGHFLASYDFEEHEIKNNGTWFIYRIN